MKRQGKSYSILLSPFSLTLYFTSMNPGHAFGDHIKTEKIKRHHYDEEAKLLRLRWYLLPVLIIFLGALLLFNLFSVQIIQGNYYQQLSDSNRIRTQIIPAPRG